MRVKLTDLQRQLLKEVYTRGIISFAEARDQNILRFFRDLKALKLVTTNQHGIIITQEGTKQAFAKATTL
jgi:hypothetical protein